MIAFLSLFLYILVSPFNTQARLEAEISVLRHQPNVLRPLRGHCGFLGQVHERIRAKKLKRQRSRFFGALGRVGGSVSGGGRVQLVR